MVLLFALIYGLSKKVTCLVKFAAEIALLVYCILLFGT
jgi:hypothetical protein